MGTGLDIGPGALRVAAEPDGDAIESVPPIVVPVDDATASDLPDDGLFVERDGTTYAVGATAEAVADATGAVSETLFSNGVLAVDGYGKPALEALLEDALGSGASDGRLCYTTPGTLVDAAEPTVAHRETVESVVAEHAIDTTPISRGFAVVYDQLAEDNYTGLGICIGSQTTSVALAYYGVPALAFSLAKGSEWIAERAAAETGREPAEIAAVREEFTLDPDAATGEVESALAQAHDALIGDLADAIAAEADENDVQQGLAVPIAVAGAGAIEGLEFLLGGRFDAAALPFSVRGVRLADDPAGSAARGALAAAEDDVDAYEDVTWSTAETDGDGSDEPNGASAGADASGSTTLSFDDELGGGADADRDRADDAIEQLFDRLADRDEEIESVRTDLESAFEDIAYVEERTAEVETVAELDERLEAFADDLRDLETESETRASDETVDELGDDLEALSTAFEDLEADVDGLATELEADLEAVESELETDIDELESDLADDLDELESGIETDLETLSETAADERAVLEERIGELSGDLDGISGRTSSRDERLETTRTDLDAVEEELTAVDDRLEATDDRVETVADDVTDARETLDDRADDLETRLESARETIEDVEATAADDKRVDAVEDDLEALEADLEELGDSVTSVSERLEALAERTALEVEVDDRLEATTAEFEATATGLEARVDDLADRADELADRTNEHGSRLDRQADSLAAHDERLESVASEIDDLAAALDATPEEAALESTDDQLYALADRVDGLESALDDVGSSTVRKEGLEALQTDVAELRERVETEEQPHGRGESSGTAETVVPIAAGGGGAGVVAGGSLALAGDGTIGAGVVVLGVVLIAGAIAASR